MTSKSSSSSSSSRRRAAEGSTLGSSSSSTAFASHSYEQETDWWGNHTAFGGLGTATSSAEGSETEWDEASSSVAPTAPAGGLAKRLFILGYIAAAALVVLITGAISLLRAGQTQPKPPISHPIIHDRSKVPSVPGARDVGTLPPFTAGSSFERLSADGSSAAAEGDVPDSSSPARADPLGFSPRETAGGVSDRGASSSLGSISEEEEVEDFEGDAEGEKKPALWPPIPEDSPFAGDVRAEFLEHGMLKIPDGFLDNDANALESFRRFLSTCGDPRLFARAAQTEAERRFRDWRLFKSYLASVSKYELEVHNKLTAISKDPERQHEQNTVMLELLDVSGLKEELAREWGEYHKHACIHPYEKEKKRVEEMLRAMEIHYSRLTNKLMGLDSKASHAYKMFWGDPKTKYKEACKKLPEEDRWLAHLIVKL